MSRITINMPDELLDQLRAIAEAENVKIAAVIRRVMKAFLTLNPVESGDN